MTDPRLAVIMAPDPSPEELAILNLVLALEHPAAAWHGYSRPFPSTPTRKLLLLAIRLSHRTTQEAIEQIFEQLRHAAQAHYQEQIKAQRATAENERKYQLEGAATLRAENTAKLLAAITQLKL